MFYSKSMLSKKGPLGNIWVAAYFFRKLKKEQIASTDISSSIDKMLHDVQLSYRTLAHLLLGIVKIFSKKVDFLYRDSNEALMKICKSSIDSQLNVSKEVANITQHKVSKQGVRAMKHKAGGTLDTITPLAGVIGGPYHDTSITIPQRFELDSFDIGVQEDRDNCNFREECNIEDAWSADTSPRTSLDKCYHRETTSHAEFSSACFTPLADVLPSYMMDIDEEINKIYKSDGGEAVGKEFREDSDHIEYCNNLETMVARNILGSTFFDMENGNHEHSESLEEIVSQTIQKNSHVNQPEIHVELVNLPETITSESHKDIGLEGLTEDRTPTKPHDNIICDKDQGPKLMVTTPAQRERFQLLRKRKYSFDETSVLTNNSLKRGIMNSSNLVCKRRKLPITCLDIWKACRFANVQEVFMEPLITCMPLELKALYKGKLPNASPLKKLSEFLVEPVEPPIEPLENAAEPIDLQDVTEPIGLQSGVEQVDHQCVIEHVNLQEGSSDNPLEKISIQENSYVLIPETPDTPAAIKLLEMKAKSMESSSSDSVLNMMDGDLDSRGGYSNEQEDDGCSETTRVVARFLHHKFNSHREGEQKKTLNLSSFLQGSTRTKSAKVFYEILALRSFGCIDVTQDSPYSDIILSATSQLENILEKH